MIHSMTGFASVRKQIGPYMCCWEVKSVNHRYLDVVFKLPIFLNDIESKLRSIVHSQLKRGRIECCVQIIDLPENDNCPVLNNKVVESLIEASKTLESKYLLGNDITSSFILQQPGVLAYHNAMGIKENSEEILNLFNDAIVNLLEMRANEGATLKNSIELHLQSLLQEIESARSLTVDFSEKVRNKIIAKLAQLDFNTPDSRIEQEIAFALLKMEVSEELDRLHGHCIEITRVLDLKEESGRKLDFLMQELNREANTLSSKSDSLIFIQKAVNMKVIIEKMREQVQNIE